MIEQRNAYMQQCADAEGDEGKQMSQPLPEGTHLAYTVHTRAGWDRRTIAVEASPACGEPAWSFHVVEDQAFDKDDHGTVLNLEIHDEVWRAFAQIPQFFAALAEGGQKLTFEDVLRLLDSLGAENQTARTRDWEP